MLGMNWAEIDAEGASGSTGGYHWSFANAFRVSPLRRRTWSSWNQGDHNILSLSSFFFRKIVQENWSWWTQTLSKIEFTSSYKEHPANFISLFCWILLVWQGINFLFELILLENLQQIVVNQFTRVAQHERCSFFGNVTLGSSVTLPELRELYDVVGFWLNMCK